MSLLHASLRHFRDLLDGLRDGVEGKFHRVFVEETEQAPEACAGAVFVFRFDVVVSFVDSGWTARVFDEVGFGLAVAAENGAFASLEGELAGIILKR